MPEITIDENSELAARDGEVGRAGSFLIMLLEVHLPTPQFAEYEHLKACVLASDVRHNFTSDFL